MQVESRQLTAGPYFTHCIKFMFLPCSLCSVMTHEMPPQMQCTTVVDMLAIGVVGEHWQAGADIRP